MTDPTEPTDPTRPDALDPVEAAVRDALTARAEGVHPRMDDPSNLDDAIAADRSTRDRSRLVLAGVGAAAVLLLVVVGVVFASGSDPDKEVTTGSDPTVSTSATSSTTDAPTTVTTTAPEVTTTAAPTSTTIAPATTAPPTTAPPTTAVPTIPGGTLDPKSGPSGGPLPALLTDVRVGCQGSASRIVFEFADGAVPEWAVEYVDPPITEDASGETVAVAGTAFLRVRLSPAWGHDLEQPDAPATYTGPARLSGGCREGVEVVRTGEFEAVYSWVIGVPVQAGFTATHLDGPSRLVVDVAT